MQLANQECQLLNLDYIGAEHLLLGLIQEGSGVAAHVLRHFNLNVRSIRLEVEKNILAVPEMVTKGKLPHSSYAKNVIVNAMEEARLLKHNYVGTEHLLLGILREKDSLAVKVLEDLGLKIKDIRDELLKQRWTVSEQYTDRSKKVMGLANQEAQLLNLEYIGAEHILLGLINEGSGVAGHVLKHCCKMNFRLIIRRVRLEVEKNRPAISLPVTLGKLPLTSHVEKVIENAMEEAQLLKHNYVGTEHLLLGILREKDCLAVKVLEDFGLSIEEIRNEVLNILGHGL